MVRERQHLNGNDREWLHVNMNAMREGPMGEAGPGEVGGKVERGRCDKQASDSRVEYRHTGIGHGWALGRMV